MTHLIDKSALVAEIERLDALYHISINLTGDLFIQGLFSFIDTLEVKEVDLEEEIIDWWNVHYSEKDYTFEGYTGHYLENSTVIEIAKHFFELGLKAQKGE